MAHSELLLMPYLIVPTTVVRKVLHRSAFTVVCVCRHPFGVHWPLVCTCTPLQPPPPSCRSLVRDVWFKDSSLW